MFTSIYPSPWLEGVPAKVCLFELSSNRVEECSKPLKVIEAIPWSTPSSAFVWKCEPDDDVRYLLISAKLEILKFSKSSLVITFTGDVSFSELLINDPVVTISSTFGLAMMNGLNNNKYMNLICLIMLWRKRAHSTIYLQWK